MCTIVQWYMHCSAHCIMHCIVHCIVHCSVHCIVHCIVHRIVHCRPVDVTEHARVRPKCKWSVLVGSTILVGGLDRGRRRGSEVVVVVMVAVVVVGKTVIPTSAPPCSAERSHSTTPGWWSRCFGVLPQHQQYDQRSPLDPVAPCLFHGAIGSLATTTVGGMNLLVSNNQELGVDICLQIAWSRHQIAKQK